LDKNQSTANPLAHGSTDGPKSRDTSSWAAKQVMREKKGMILAPLPAGVEDTPEVRQRLAEAIGERKPFDPESVPERDRIITFCRFMIFNQRYKASEATRIVDYYLNFLESHPELEE